MLNVNYIDARSYAVVNNNVLSLRLYSDVSVIVLSSIGRAFHARGPATENERSPNLRWEDLRTRS